MEEEGKRRLLLTVLICLFLIGILGFFLQNKFGRFWSAKADIKKAIKKSEQLDFFSFEISLKSTLSPYSEISQVKGEVDLPNQLKAAVFQEREIILINKMIYQKAEKDQKWYRFTGLLNEKFIFNPADYLTCLNNSEKLGKNYYKGEIDLAKCAKIIENLGFFLKTKGNPKVEEVWLENDLPSKIKVEFKSDLELLMIMQISFTYLSSVNISSPKNIFEDKALEEMNKRDGVRKQNLAQIKTALEGYAKDSGASLPVALNWENINQSNILSQILIPVYLEAIPKDPLAPAHRFFYKSENGNDFSLRSIIENKANFEAKQEGDLFIYELKGVLNQGGQGEEPISFYSY